MSDDRLAGLDVVNDELTALVNGQTLSSKILLHYHNSLNKWQITVPGIMWLTAFIDVLTSNTLIVFNYQDGTEEMLGVDDKGGLKTEGARIFTFHRFIPES